MSKNDYYIIEKNLNKILHNESTYFLDPKTLKDLQSKLKNINYNIYKPFPEADKTIIYKDKICSIKLLEIISYEKLSHREILGSLYGLNIDSSLFGDIIITSNHYYILIIENIYPLIQKELIQIGNKKINIKEVDLSLIESYQRKYDELELIVSSLRIDTVISRITNINRDHLKDKFKDKEIILNYEPCLKTTYLLKENDIFSIRKYGKYKFGGIIKESKKGNLIIKVYKYLDE